MNKLITSRTAVDSRNLKVEAAEQDFPNCSHVINRTYQYPMLNYLNKE